LNDNSFFSAPQLKREPLESDESAASHDRRTTVDGPWRALQPFLEDLERLGDTPFLADPKPWIEGTTFDLIE
jgi:hypothetical protein